MKKILYIIALSSMFSLQLTFGGVVSRSCGLINSPTGNCNECFEETTKIYGCNPYQTSCIKEGLNSLSDTLKNTGTTQRVQWVDGIGPGVVQEYELQSTADWVIADDPIYEVPSAFGPIYNAANGNRYTIYDAGNSKKWIQMKTGKFYRFEQARSGTDKTKPVFRVDYVPKSQVVISTNPTVLGAEESHRQCVFYNPSFCGDGVKDTDKSEQCDDGNQTNGDGCSNTCQTEATPLTCDTLGISPATLTQTGGTITASCAGTNETQYKFVLKQGTTVVDAGTYQAGATKSFTIPANTETTAKSYSVDCFVKNATETDKTATACNKSLSVPGVTISAPTCDNLTISNPSGTRVDYTCTGTGNITSYAITRNGNLIGSTASGTVNAAGYGTHTFICTVNGTLTSNSCQKSITFTEDRPNPRIEVIKDDNDNRDDTQQVSNGGVASFSIRVRNNGPESLENVTLDDPRSPSCNRSSSDTYNLIRNIGNRDNRFDPGESFTYTCQRHNVDTNTFPNNENRICVDGRGETSGINVNDCDTTRIYPGGATCERMDVNYRNIGDKSNIQVTCGPTGLYRLAVTRGGQVITRQQSPDGRFSFDLGKGNYSIGCLRDGETSVKPQCQKTIKIEDRPDGNCTMISSVRYGGAPLRTQLSCENSSNNNCIMEIYRNGKLGKTIHSCQSNMTLSQKGNYDIICKPSNNERSCETSISVDVLTNPKTGNGAWMMLIVAILGGASVLYWRRRKTV